MAFVWVGTSRPASWACRSATAAGNAMPKHGARVARRRDCAAFGYIDHRAPAACVQRLRPLRWSADWEGCRRCRSGHGGEGLPSRGSGGAAPCRGAASRPRAGRLEVRFLPPRRSREGDWIEHLRTTRLAHTNPQACARPRVFDIVCSCFFARARGPPGNPHE